MNDFIQLIKSKNISQIKHNLTYSLIGKIACIPIAAFFISVVIELIKALTTTMSFDLEMYNPYAYTISYINVIATVFGILAIFLYLLRLHFDHKLTKKHILKHPSILLFIILSIWIIITTAINGFTPYALHGTYYRNESLFTFLRYYLIYFMCGVIVTNKQKDFLLHLLMYSSMILVFCNLLDYINMLNDQFMTLWSSVFYNTNHYGYYLTIVCLVSMSYFLTNEHNLKYLVIFCFNLIVLLFNNTFGSYLGVLIGLIFALAVSFKVNLINKQRIITIAIIIVLSTIFVKAINPLSSGNFTQLYTDLSNVTEENSEAQMAGSNRWGLWLYSINKLNKKPSAYITGYGIEGITDQMSKKTGESRPHNEFLQQVVFFGLPALILYVVAIFLIYLRGYHYASTLSIPTIVALIAAFGYLFQSSFGNTMYYTSPFFFSILGMTYYHK